MNLTDVKKIMPLMIPGRFANRHEAGRALAAALTKKIPELALSTAGLKKDKNFITKSVKNWLVVGIPRGGVPVAAFVAKALGLPLDVVLVKKLTPPDSHELAIGAVASDGGLLVDEKAATEFGATPASIKVQRQALITEMARRDRAFHLLAPKLPVKDQNIILVDDGMATGYTARVAAELLRRQGAKTIIAAAPVVSKSAEKLVGPAVDTVVAAKIDPLLYAVGSHYVDFAPVSESDVTRLLEQNRAQV